MNRTRRHNRRTAKAEINVVPYIDVMLVLLVIFMVTTPLLTQGIQVNLPHTAAKAIKPNQDLPVVLSIRADGKYFLNVSAHPHQPISAHDLQTRVMAIMQLDQQQHHHRGIYVKADQSISYGTVASAMSLLQRAGADQVGLITRR